MSHWLVEAVRLRESLWGPLADDAEIRALRARDVPLDVALTQRAEQLAGREGLVEAVRTWRSGANWAALLLGLVAVLLGAGTASAALGDASRPVNLLWAVSGLLGLHVLTLLLWLGGLVWSLATGASSGGALGKLWLALARRAARGPAGALAPQSLMNLMARARLLPWLLGAVSHAVWLLALGAALVTLLALLATRRYDFVWETTILDPRYVEQLALWLGSIPGMLGLPTPDAALIRASDGLATQPADGRAIWAGWLLGVVAVYGLFPRALALAACVWKVRRGVTTLALDYSLPGLDTLEARLRPGSRRTGVVDPAPAGEWSATIERDAPPAGRGPDLAVDGVVQRGGLAGEGAGRSADTQPGVPDSAPDLPNVRVAFGSEPASPVEQYVSPGQAWVVSVELPEDLRAAQLPYVNAPGAELRDSALPSSALRESTARTSASPGVSPHRAPIHDAGVIDSGPQREAAIDRLHAARPSRLLIVCDARQTPDRGTVALVAELASLAAQRRVLLAGADTASVTRRQAWVDRLAASDLADAIGGREADVWDWLATGVDAGLAAGHVASTPAPQAPPKEALP